MKILGKHVGRGFRSLYELTFPRTGRKLRVEDTMKNAACRNYWEHCKTKKKLMRFAGRCKSAHRLELWRAGMQASATANREQANFYYWRIFCEG